MSVRKGEIDAGPLRVRGKLEPTYGKCTAKGCPIVDTLYDGLCDFHRWMLNDSEADPKKNHKRGKEPSFTGKAKNVRKES